ncbi:hypothetical protein [Pedobacter agri]|uniref:hypothetical protein n=1 Tax=Pedobacter agri TaxID=454586 RepID=UPI00292D6FB8|nr:hypothetical protein [Pedobacter agri]
MSSGQLWKGANGIDLPTSLSKPREVLPFATSLTELQQNKVVNAFKGQAYDMAAEYVWKRAIIKLKETIATLGMTFIGEMLNRSDIDEFTTVDSALTDYTTIQLAEQLGVVSKTAAFKLRQANELITHHFSKDAEEELDFAEAFNIVKTGVKYILGEQEISIALEFSEFRNRLLTESLVLQDTQVEQVVNSPVFYLRTVVTVLVTAIKNEISAKLEYALTNLNVLLPAIWEKLGENDKYNIGTTYRDVTAAGNATAISGVKSALLKVGGFDYVPENLRSITFIKAAKQLLDVHFEFNNFYNEPAAIRKLANLGNVIPPAALIECMQAYLAVFLGNRYGVSSEAYTIAEHELAKISADRWLYYFQKGINKDEVVLNKFYKRNLDYFADFLVANALNKFEDLPRKNKLLYDGILEKNFAKIQKASNDLLSIIK